MLKCEEPVDVFKELLQDYEKRILEQYKVSFLNVRILYAYISVDSGARRMRKKAHTTKTRPTDIGTGVVRAPPAYSNNNNSYGGTGISPPPTYQDAVLEQLYHECLPPKRRRSSAGKHSLK